MIHVSVSLKKAQQMSSAQPPTRNTRNEKKKKNYDSNKVNRKSKCWCLKWVWFMQIKHFLQNSELKNMKTNHINRNSKYYEVTVLAILDEL